MALFNKKKKMILSRGKKLLSIKNTQWAQDVQSVTNVLRHTPCSKIIRLSTGENQKDVCLKVIKSNKVKS